MGHCFVCEVEFSKKYRSTRKEKHHFPVPARYGGGSTIPLCTHCHSMIDRHLFGDPAYWPLDKKIYGFSNWKSASPGAAMVAEWVASPERISDERVRDFLYGNTDEHMVVFSELSEMGRLVMLKVFKIAYDTLHDRAQIDAIS